VYRVDYNEKLFVPAHTYCGSYSLINPAGAVIANVYEGAQCNITTTFKDRAFCNHKGNEFWLALHHVAFHDAGDYRLRGGPPIMTNAECALIQWTNITVRPKGKTKRKIMDWITIP